MKVNRCSHCGEEWGVSIFVEETEYIGPCCSEDKEKANHEMVSHTQANNTISFDFLQVGEIHERV